MRQLKITKSITNRESASLGIRDLMLDINSTGESVEVINKMMEWSSKYLTGRMESTHT